MGTTRGMGFRYKSVAPIRKEEGSIYFMSRKNGKMVSEYLKFVYNFFHNVVRLSIPNGLNFLLYHTLLSHY